MIFGVANFVTNSNQNFTQLYEVPIDRTSFFIYIYLCKGSQWYADVDGCRQYIFLWAHGRTAIKIYPRPFSKMDDDGNITVGVNWFIEPAAYTDEEMQTEEFKLANSFFKISER